MEKRCTKCKQIKAFCNFNKNKKGKFGLNYWCNCCFKKYYKKYYQDNEEKIKEYKKKYKQDNIDKVKIYHKKYNYDNKERICQNRKEYYQNNKEKYKEYHKKYIKENKENIKKYNNEYSKNKRKIDIHYKLRSNVSSLISNKLKRKLSSKNNNSIIDFLSYTINDLMKHLEKQFTKGMSWDNYGKWHIDHIKPDSLFNYKSIDDKEFQECWSLKNLQPLWAKENWSKNKFYN